MKIYYSDAKKCSYCCINSISSFKHCISTLILIKNIFTKLINFNLPISLQISLSVATALVAYSPKTEHVFQKS